MIEAKILKRKGCYKSVSIKGHAEYDDAGKDIVCAAVSVLVINTANALEGLTDNRIAGSMEDGLCFSFLSEPDEKGRLLIETMLMGLRDIQKKYGNGHLRLEIEEV